MKRKKSKRLISVIAILVGLGVFALLLPVGYAGQWLLGSLQSESPEPTSVYDSLNTIFGGISQMLIGAALLLSVFQFMRQSKEMEKQDQAIEEQRQAFEEDAVRTSFFRLLQSWCEYVESTKFTTNKRRAGSVDSTIYSGRNAYIKIANLISVPPTLYKSDSRDEWITREIDKAASYYEDAYEKFTAELSTYMRLLYHCLKFIDESNISAVSKKSLVGILRAHLTQSELKLIMLNGLTEKGEKFYWLVEKHHFLHNYTPETLGDFHCLIVYPSRFVELQKSHYMRGRFFESERHHDLPKIPGYWHPIPPLIEGDSPFERPEIYEEVIKNRIWTQEAEHERSELT